MGLLYQIFIDPFVQMGTAPDLFVQTLWEGMVGGVLYALIALGFVLIFKASGVFNFAQGIMVVFAAMSPLRSHFLPGVGVRSSRLCRAADDACDHAGYCFGTERLILRLLINQPDVILFMATFGPPIFIKLGELAFGRAAVMIASELGLPRGIDFKIPGGR
jgi:branched-chain amino acid transport system permease protein